MMQIQTRVIINDDVLGRTAGELRGEHCGARPSMIIETTAAQKRGPNTRTFLADTVLWSTGTVPVLYR